MSALTEKVAREHWAYRLSTSRTGQCLGCGATVGSIQEWNAHVSEVAEAATRAAVAADIRAQRFIDATGRHSSPDEAAFDDALTFAARIAEGKQP